MDCYRVIGGLKNGILPSLQTCHHNSVVAVVVLLPTVQKEGGEYYYNTQQMMSIGTYGKIQTRNDGVTH